MRPRLLALTLSFVACAPTKPRPPAVALDASEPSAPAEDRTTCRDGELGGPTTHGRWWLTGRAKDVDPARGRLVAEGVCALSDALRTCQIEAHKSGTVEGTLEVALTLDAKGKVISAKRVAGTIPQGEFAACSEKVLAAAQFEGPVGAGVTWQMLVSGARVVRMKEVGTDIQGRLPPELILRIVRARFPAIRACYETLLRQDAGAQGLLRIEFIIDEKGTPTRLDTKGSVFDADTAACMKKVFAAMEFPEPEFSKVLVRYPIEFTAGAD